MIATPGADRIARGEEWLQTNTLDGQKAMDAFIRIGEPAYFQEYGPAGYHDSIGFANPAIINARHAGVCNGTDLNVTGKDCLNTLKGKVTGERLSRTPDERLYSSGSHDTYAFTQCYVSFGDSDGEDFAFTKCNADGTFTIANLPDGIWRITVFDQWNDQIVDGLSTPVYLSGGKVTFQGRHKTALAELLGEYSAEELTTVFKTFIGDKDLEEPYTLKYITGNYLDAADGLCYSARKHKQEATEAQIARDAVVARLQHEVESEQAKREQAKKDELELFDPLA